MPDDELDIHTPCGWCGHQRAYHSDYYFDPACLYLYGEPDSCTCAAWQEPDK